jgi:uncharacterized protein YlzI (FlbEa/FlbD family)
MLMIKLTHQKTKKPVIVNTTNVLYIEEHPIYGGTEIVFLNGSTLAVDELVDNVHSIVSPKGEDSDTVKEKILLVEEKVPTTKEKNKNKNSSSSESTE